MKYYVLEHRLHHDIIERHAAQTRFGANVILQKLIQRRSREGWAASRSGSMTILESAHRPSRVVRIVSLHEWTRHWLPYIGDRLRIGVDFAGNGVAGSSESLPATHPATRDPDPAEAI